MNLVLMIISADKKKIAENICSSLKLRCTTVMLAKGTAVMSMRDILGIKSDERRLIMAFADEEKTHELIKNAKRELYIGVPGHGIIAAVPIKSVGGGKTLAYLNGDNTSKIKPDLNYNYELITVIANEGKNQIVMNAARNAGAAGGTVLHGKGTASPDTEKFFNVTIGEEKEVILIVAASDKKAEIMQAIIKEAGPNTEAGAVTFSLPVTEVAGFGLINED